MNYWIFKADSNQYDIDRRLAYSNPQISWRVHNYQKEIKAGDIAFIWRTGSKRGIIGIIDIKTNPEIIDELKHEIQFYKNSVPFAELRITGLLRSARMNLLHTALKEIPDTSELPVFMNNINSKFTRATNYALDEEQGDAIMKLIKEKKA